MYYNVCKGIAIEYLYDEVLEKFSTYFCEYSNLIDHVITIFVDEEGVDEEGLNVNIENNLESIVS